MSNMMLMYKNSHKSPSFSNSDLTYLNLFYMVPPQLMLMSLKNINQSIPEDLINQLIFTNKLSFCIILIGEFIICSN